MSKIVDSHNANICCQKLYSVWSSSDEQNEEK